MTLWMRPRRNDEADKATWPDLSGNEHHGTLENFTFDSDCGWALDPPRLVANRDGINSVIQYNSGVNNGEAELTIEMRIRKLTVATSGNRYAVMTNLSTGGFMLYTAPNASNFSWAVVAVEGNQYLTAYPDGLDIWRQVALTIDASGLQAWLDGVAYGAKRLRTYVPATSTIFRLFSSFNSPLLGDCSLVRYYNRALSAEEIAQNYAAGTSGKGYVTSGLVLDLNAAYCAPILPGVVSRARERATPYTVSFSLHTVADPTTPVTGLTPAVIVARDGGVFATAAEAVTEPGSAGVYAVPLTDDEMDADEVGLVASASGVTDHVEVLQTVPDVQAAAAAALTAYPVPTKAELDAAVAPLAQEETLGAVADVTDAIKLRTDRIGTASAVVVAPVTTAGTLMLRQGDDYDSAHGRAVTFTVDDATHKLELDDPAVVVRLKSTQATWTATGVTSTADGYLITFEPSAADTRALTIPRQSYELEAKLADGDIVTLTVGTLVCERDIPAVT